MLWYFFIGTLFFIAFMAWNLKTKFRPNGTELVISFGSCLIFWPLFVIVWVIKVTNFSFDKSVKWFEEDIKWW